MKSKIAHIYLYVSDLETSYKFYKPLLEYLDYKQLAKKDWGFAFIKNGTSFWFEQTPKDHIADGYHRRRTGLNHIAFRVNSKEEVDKFYKELLKRTDTEVLYDSPKPWPEYEDEYYAVYFEDPDRIKLEVAYYP